VCGPASFAGQAAAMQNKGSMPVTINKKAVPQQYGFSNMFIGEF
jgi:hypothetical protein